MVVHSILARSNSNPVGINLKACTSVVLMVFISMACQSSKTSERNNVLDTGSVEKLTLIVNADEEVLTRLNTTLFEDLVNDNYGPHPVRSADGFIALDWESYQSYLKLINIFGQSFLDQEFVRTKPCMEALDSLKYSGEPAAGWEPEACSFTYLYWLNSPEKPNAFEIQDLQIKGNRASSKMVFFDEAEDGRHYWNDMVYLTIEYGQENGQWKIFKLNKLPQR
jgi:hypothetical protein